MRYFASFMALMMLALSILPCRDNRGMEFAAASSTLSSSHDPHQHEDHKDICSPLCSCACCATSSITAPAIEFTSLPARPNPRVGGFRSGSLRRIAIPIWQPPQLLS